MNYNLVSQKTALLFAIIIMCIVITDYAVADDSFNSIGGYSIGQSCTSNEFASSESTVSNPNDVLDKIDVKRNQIKKKLDDGYDLLVQCSIVNNKVKHVSLSARNLEDISVIKDSLKEKMGRPADDTEERNSEPKNLLGNRFDGRKIENEYWFLSDNRKATAFTFTTIPYGASSISELKWWGGISLSVKGSDILEWNHLKQKGSLSSNQQESLTEEKKKNRVRGLLE